MQWLGIKGTEWAALGVDRDELLPLTKADRVKALSILKKDNLPDAWRCVMILLFSVLPLSLTDRD